MMKSCEIAVIGAGASGLMAARCAALNAASRAVVLLEGNQKPGKKLLATGNGRCNLTNMQIIPDHYHGDVREAAGLLSSYPAESVLGEFEKMGLLCRADGEERVYPNNLQAAAVLQALRYACEEAGVESVCEFEVVSVTCENGGFLIKASDGRGLRAEKCILACGGMASPKHSCKEKGYGLVKSLGHTVTGLSPSLVGVKSGSKMLKALKGMRAKARVSLVLNEKEGYAESGEVIFGDGSLSGICVFNLSARLRDTLGAEAGAGKAGRGETAEIQLDLLENMTGEELRAYLRMLQKTHPALPAGELFSGILNLRIGQEIIKNLGVNRDRPLSSLSNGELDRAAACAKKLRFPVSGPGAWEAAQVTGGGVPLSELYLETMESRKQPGLYLTGELLNVDGDCGGYNLHWAWLTGMLAGRCAARGESPEKHNAPASLPHGKKDGCSPC